MTARDRARSARGKPSPSASTFTLGDLLSSVSVLDVVVAPSGLDIAVGETVIHDPAAPPAIEAGAFVLGVGVDVRTRDARDLIVRCGSARAAAVALKLDGQNSVELRETAEQAKVALVAVPDEMTWAQLHTLARTARAADSSDVAGAPLGDLFALANAFADMVGGPVTIEDRHSRVIAYSSHAQRDEDIDEPRRRTILGRRVPDEWLARLEEAGVFKRLWAGEIVRYEAPEDLALRPRMALAVRAGEEILGSIWVAQGERPLDALAEDALREATRIAALHLIRHRSAEDLDRSMRGDALRSLLDGQGSVDAIAYRLGVAADGTFAVLAFEPSSHDDVEGALQRERVTDLVSLYGEAFRQRSASVSLGRSVYVLLPGPEPSRPQRLVEVASDVVERARDAIGIELRAGIGSIVAGLRDVPRSRREADQVLRALAEGNANVADFEAARTRVALIDLRDFVSDRPQMRSAKVRRLHDHDHRHGTCYVETLRAYLDAFGDIARAAAASGVHVNTLRYRLRRALEESQINLGDPDERLLVEIDLRLGAGE